MTVQDIYKRVRLCFDEEALNVAGFDDASSYDFDGMTTDNGLMNHIIKDKIGDALRWICLYAPAEQLSGGSDGDNGENGSDGAIDIVVDDKGSVPLNGMIPLGKNFIRLIRIRCNGWHRAVMGESLLREDDDKYLQLDDEYGAEATENRPQAALIETAEKKVQVFPHDDGMTYELTKLVMPSSDDFRNLTDGTTVNIPPLLETSFVYYLAFLTLSAYEDSRSQRMLDIAKMSLGQTEDAQRA